MADSDADETTAAERWLEQLDPNDPTVHVHNVEPITAAATQLHDAIAAALTRGVPMHVINFIVDDLEDRLSVLLQTGDTTPLGDLTDSLGITDEIDDQEG